MFTEINEVLKKARERRFDKMQFDQEEIECLLSPVSLSHRDNSKVQVKADCRDLRDLQYCFKYMPEDVLIRVWKSNNQSWDACYDLLNAWLASHGPLLSGDQLIFVLDAEIWPQLSPRHTSVTVPRHLSLTDLVAGMVKLTLPDRSSLSTASDSWSFCELSDGNDSSSDAGDSWVEVQHQDHGKKEPEKDQFKFKEADKAAPVTTRPAPRTFRDILLTPTHPSPPALSPPSRGKRPRSNSGGGERTAWRPTVVCVRLGPRRRREDVLYMDSDEVLGALPPACCCAGTWLYLTTHTLCFCSCLPAAVTVLSPCYPAGMLLSSCRRAEVGPRLRQRGRGRGGGGVRKWQRGRRGQQVLRAGRTDQFSPSTQCRDAAGAHQQQYEGIALQVLGDAQPLSDWEASSKWRRAPGKQAPVISSENENNNCCIDC